MCLILCSLLIAGLSKFVMTEVPLVYVDNASVERIIKTIGVKRSKSKLKLPV